MQIPSQINNFLRKTTNQPTTKPKQNTVSRQYKSQGLVLAWQQSVSVSVLDIKLESASAARGNICEEVSQMSASAF